MFKPITLEEYQALGYPGNQPYLARMRADWAERNGLRSAQTGLFCPSRLISRQHRHDSDGRCAGCDLVSRSWVLDHRYMFKKKEWSPYSLDCMVVHPYSLSEWNIEELETICNRFGLEYEIHPPSESWYNWHATYMVVIRRKAGEPE